MKKQFIEDRVILMLLAGAVSAAIANTFGYLTKLLYPPTIVMPEVAAELFVHPEQTRTVLGIIFGNLWSYSVGGLHAVIYVFTLDLTGWRHFWLKSFAVTNIGWLLGVGLIFQGLGIATRVHDNILSVVLFYGAHLVYLTVSADIVSKLGVPLNRPIATEPNQEINKLLKENKSAVNRLEHELDELNDNPGLWEKIFGRKLK